jgi:D-alanyl-D-alanine dipeptidase
MHWLAAGLAGALAAAGTGAAAEQSAPRLPGTLVYLRDVDPTIVQDIRYAQADNFTGGRVAGYEAGECILLRTAARALAQVQADLRAKQLSLKVYDCYRPPRAVRAFLAWAGQPERGATKRFYPRLDKRALFSGGYIAHRSTHSRGSTVDVTLVALPVAEAAAFDPAARYRPCTAAAAERAPDNSLDMGTGFDCFDALSHTRSGGLTAEQRRARSTLAEAMARRGFRGFAREWWHFTHAAGGDAVYDFPIRPRPGKE